MKKGLRVSEGKPTYFATMHKQVSSAQVSIKGSWVGVVYNINWITSQHLFNYRQAYYNFL
jgi:hypothetical protein